MRDYAGPELPSVSEIKAQFPTFRLDVPLFKGQLDPHQHVAVACAHVAKRFLNMDKVGLGKTVETIGLIAYHLGLGIKPRWIIVVESSHLYQWKSEIERFLDFPATIVRGTKKKRTRLFTEAYRDESFILLCTYGSVRVDFDLIRRIPDRKMAYDEAALLANENATHKFTSWLNRGVEYVVEMSAEPVTRGDVSQLHMCFKAMGLHLMDDDEFERQFLVTKQFPIRVNGQYGPFIKTIVKVTGAKNIDKLRKLISPNSIRRGDNVLPAGTWTINRQVRSCTMEPHQKRLYKTVRKGFRSDRGELSRVEQLNTADIVTQILVSPWVHDSTHPQTSPKVDVLANILEFEIPEEKAVVFCRHLKSCELVEKLLREKYKVKSAVYTGETSDPKKKHAIIQSFINDKRIRVLIVSGAGHRGIDGMQKVSKNLILLDVVHSPTFVVQLIGRLARRGQISKIVNLFFILADDSVETEVMDKLHTRQTVTDRLYKEDKAQLFDSDPKDVLLDLL